MSTNTKSTNKDSNRGKRVGTFDVAIPKPSNSCINKIVLFNFMKKN